MHLTLIQAIIFSILQGASELFPVSSLGHAIVLPVLAGWNRHMLDSKGPFLPFLVTLHLGTAFALLIFYWKDWVRICGAFLANISGKKKPTPDEKVFLLLVYGTVPCAVILFFLQEQVRQLLSSPVDVAILLIVNGFVMIGAEKLRKSAEVAPDEEAALVSSGQRKKLSDLTPIEAVTVSVAQSLALLPGISRSGVTMVGGLLNRLTHDDAARYSFLLGTPIIFLAGLSQVPKLKDHLGTPHIVEYSIIGFFVSGITAFISVRFLTKYFETSRLDPFGYYCIVIGLVTVGALHFHP